MNKKQIGHHSEEAFVKAFPEFTLVSDIKMQYADIDAINPAGITVSIKSQETQLTTGNFSFETILKDTRTGKEQLGNFYTCKADFYAIWSGKHWYLLKTDMLHSYVKFNSKKGAWLKDWRAEDNRKQGRKYDQAYSMLVKVKEIADLSLITA